MKTKEQLQQEVEEISKEIYEIQQLMEETTDNCTRGELANKLKELRWQALFYLGTIENMGGKNSLRKSEAISIFCN
ncbi:MAG: hypothetical protein N3B21_18190 [Clostridia bacterium]|nr:hypothetical protein [Clostridia bacterium]